MNGLLEPFAVHRLPPPSNWAAARAVRYDAAVMHLARVIGTVVSTAKNEGLTGRKLLVIQPVDARANDEGRAIVAVDSIGAGVGEVVIWCRGKESSFPFLPGNVPTDCTIVGIVDQVFLDGRVTEGRP